MVQAVNTSDTPLMRTAQNNPLSKGHIQLTGLKYLIMNRLNDMFVLLKHCKLSHEIYDYLLKHTEAVLVCHTYERTQFVNSLLFATFIIPDSGVLN